MQKSLFSLELLDADALIPSNIEEKIVARILKCKRTSGNGRDMVHTTPAAPADTAIGAVTALNPEEHITGILTARAIEYAAARVGVAYLKQNIRLFIYTQIKVTQKIVDKIHEIALKIRNNKHCGYTLHHIRFVIFHSLQGGFSAVYDCKIQ